MSIPRRALLAVARRVQPDVELGLARRTEVAAHRDAVGRDDVGLGLARRAEAQRCRALRIDTDRPGDALRFGVGTHRRGVIVDDDADHGEVGILLVLGVEGLERGLLLPARDAPTVEEVIRNLPVRNPLIWLKK